MLMQWRISFSIASTTRRWAASSPPTSTTATSTTSPTTTVVTPSCGNGVRDPGEQCDPGASGSADSYCCSRDCRVIRIGLNCGSRQPGLCEYHDTCDGQGSCHQNIK